MNTATATTITASARSSTSTLWRPGVVAGLIGAAATCAIVAVARAADVPVAVNGKIPLFAFAQFSFVGALLGVGIAKLVSRHTTTNAARAFTRVTVALTVLSLVPDVIVDATVATKLTLALTHGVAAAIVIPVLRARLSN
jgi:Family of unknown function (DUF6069)